MSQASIVIGNTDFPSYRSNHNAANEALATKFLGATAPSTIQPLQWFANSTDGLLYCANTAGTAWIEVGKLDEIGFIGENSGSPIGSVTPDFERQFLYDTTNNILSTATGTANTDWMSVANNFNYVKSITNTDSPYTALTSDSVIECDCTSGAITVNLYAVSGNAGRELTIIKSDTSTNFVTISGTGLSYKLYTQNESISIFCDGTNWMAKGGLPDRQLIQAVSASSVATVDFTIGIDNTFDRYLVEMISVKAATDAVIFAVRTTSDGGSTWDSGATDYYVSLLTMGGGLAGNGTALSLVAYTGTAGARHLGNGASESFSGELYCYSPSDTTNQKLFKYSTTWIDTDALSQFLTGGGQRVATSAINGLRFYMTSGNIASGELRLWGLR